VSRLELHAVYTVPMWDDRGRLRVCNPWRPPGWRDGSRLARNVVGWASLAEMTVCGERYLLWLEDVEEEPDDGEELFEPDYDDVGGDLTGF
jgi:hypothetical protein